MQFNCCRSAGRWLAFLLCFLEDRWRCNDSALSSSACGQTRHLTGCPLPAAFGSSDQILRHTCHIVSPPASLDCHVFAREEHTSLLSKAAPSAMNLCRRPHRSCSVRSASSAPDGLGGSKSSSERSSNRAVARFSSSESSSVIHQDVSVTAAG